jgi:DNA-binding CsgD family transcriptional regulator
MAAVRTADLVGRDHEMQQLESAVASARRGEQTALLVEGEAGIGKSRLLSEATLDFTNPGDIVVRSQAVELAGGDVPYGVVADMLRDLGRRQVGVGRSLDPAVRDNLRNLLTTLTGGDAPRLDRGQLLDSLVTLVETLGHGRLLWWVVEDIHWSDPSSRDVLGYLLRVMGPANVLVTITVRSGEAWPAPLSEFVAEIVRTPRMSRLILRPLGEEGVREQVRQLTEGPVDAPILDRLCKLGEGIPFWTEELVLGGLADSGPVPATVRQLIEARLLRLEEGSRPVVEAVSVVDRAEHTMLQAVCGVDEDTVERACDDAVRNHILLVSDDGAGYRFRHALLREAVAQSLLPGRRMRLHRRWAEQLDLAARLDSRLGIEAAHHWSRAGDDAKALSATYAAAKLAQQAAGLHEQAQLLTRVIEHWNAVPDAAQLVGEERPAVLVRCIAALFAAGQFEECLALVEQEQLTQRDPVAVLYLRLRRHVVLEDLARDDEDAAALADLPAAAETLMASPLEGPWLSSALFLCAYYLSDDDPETAVRLCERSAEAARAQDELSPELLAMDALSWNLANLGRFDEAITVLSDGVALARSRSGDPSIASMLESNLSWYLWALGRHAEAVDAARSAIAYVRRPQAAPQRVAWMSESLAEALISQGEWDEATRILDDTVGLGLSGQAAVTLHCLTGLLAVRRGDVVSARKHLDVARQHTPPQEDALLSQRLPPRWLAAELAAVDRDVATVRTELAPLWASTHPEVVSESIWRPMLLLARLEADDASIGAGSDGAGASSWEVLSEVESRLHRVGPTGDAWRRQLAAERSRANGVATAEDWRAVVDSWERVRQTPEKGYALARLAECQALAGDRESAVESLTAAAAIADQLGAGLLAGEVAGLSRRLRLGLGPALPRQRSDAKARTGALTPREVEVLALVAEGLDNAGVAQRLFISSKTASVHVSNILAKLGATSRTQAASMALRQGLITVEPEEPS